MKLSPGIDGWIPAVCFGLAFHVGWVLVDLACALVIWLASHIKAVS